MSCYQDKLQGYKYMLSSFFARLVPVDCDNKYTLLLIATSFYTSCTFNGTSTMQRPLRVGRYVELIRVQ